MYQKICQIDEQYVKITCDSSSLWEYVEPNFITVPSTVPDQADIEIDILGDYGIPFTGFTVHVADLNRAVLFKRDDYLIAATPDFRKAVIKAHDFMALKHALLNFYSSYLIHHQSGLLIHSSCVVDHGAAHLFAGISGAGKSTVARLSYPRKLLSDEATLIKVSPEAIDVYNSPFRSDIPAADGGNSCALKSIQLLHQSSQNQRTRAAQETGFNQLFERTFYWPCKEQDVLTIRALLKKVVERVPVYDLSFQKNSTFWTLIS
ncbi:hypothetical protein E4665_03285 [Sporolactobacillus shoreae]|uniref:Uncharacterized protein n=1 Tax=Sporolactobacillus shoreae TaxID=1465501 RepID=A0A4Z0GS37_9BACL|nr:hypothetical protein [Sporolactobacillus shoreae]TGA99985.1 hypothetical protein E4665_03285 [Sporolactobacillus shoreae]